jgi:hypothetical protein
VHRPARAEASPRSQRLAERRARPVEARLELFGTLGYARTSIRAVITASALG